MNTPTRPERLELTPEQLWQLRVQVETDAVRGSMNRRGVVVQSAILLALIGWIDDLQESNAELLGIKDDTQALEQYMRDRGMGPPTEEEMAEMSRQIREHAAEQDRCVRIVRYLESLPSQPWPIDDFVTNVLAVGGGCND